MTHIILKSKEKPVNQVKDLSSAHFQRAFPGVKTTIEQVVLEALHELLGEAQILFFSDNMGPSAVILQGSRRICLLSEGNWFGVTVHSTSSHDPAAGFQFNEEVKHSWGQVPASFFTGKCAEFQPWLEVKLRSVHGLWRRPQGWLRWH